MKKRTVYAKAGNLCVICSFSRDLAAGDYDALGQALANLAGFLAGAKCSGAIAYSDREFEDLKASDRAPWAACVRSVN